MAGKTDGNADRIVSALRNAGAVVWYIESPFGLGGLPDVVVGYRGRNYLFEIKARRGRLSPKQKRFIATWPGQVAVVRTVDEALAAIGIVNQTTKGTET